jgi:hypothetical protein
LRVNGRFSFVNQFASTSSNGSGGKASNVASRFPQASVPAR